MSALVSRPSLPRRPARPNGYRAEAGKMEASKPGKPTLDTWGFPLTILPDMPGRSKQYLARAYDFLGLDKRNPPAVYGAGTTPELVVFGGLLALGFEFRTGSWRSFEFQSNLLGGRRIPGGTVADFTVWNGATRIAVYVESVFHQPSFIWTGRGKVEEERVTRLKVLARTGIDRVVEMNSVDRGMPLEHGPDSLVDAEFQRLLSA
ncbi:MAG: hypothetical protein M5U09_12440 [Gammaproteobacteria bacterium]|nr:hypothetical protein [Gammaproteobacteria bacterium]